MKMEYFQAEETYLFSSLLDVIKDQSKKDVNITTKCLLAIFWKIYGKEEALESLLLEEIEKEIAGYNDDPSRESNRIKKVFACAAYMCAATKPRHEEILRGYLSYARDSKDWLGQPRLACCISFIHNNLMAEEARAYLRENFHTWLSEDRYDFVAIALLSLGRQVSEGDLQRVHEHVDSAIGELSLSTTALLLSGISQSVASFPGKDVLEDNLYRAIQERVRAMSSLEDEEAVLAASAILIAKYHRISGYFEKYAADLKHTLDQKDHYADVTKRINRRNLLLCLTLILAVGLICFILYVPSLLDFGKNLSVVGRILKALNGKAEYAFPTAAILIAYILVSYFKTGDPILGIVDYLKEKAPGLFKNNKETK